jgi:hypothetical protein
MRGTKTAGGGKEQQVRRARAPNKLPRTQGRATSKERVTGAATATKRKVKIQKDKKK